MTFIPGCSGMLNIFMLSITLLFGLVLAPVCATQNIEENSIISPTIQNQEQELLGEKNQKNSYKVRVLLAEESRSTSNFSWTISAEQGFFLADSLQGPNTMKSSCTVCTVSFKDGAFTINNKRITKPHIIVRPQQGHLQFEDSSYDGCFMFIADEERCYFVNILDLEEYVYSVVRSEGWPGWPHEMNKVLAVTCRTYVIAMIKEARESKRLYDIKNSNVHQTYKGVHNQQVLKKAVDDTKGFFISYENKPILAMFDICCGGVVPAGIDGFNFDRAPYLARSYPCTYCKDCSSYSWNMSLGKKELLNYLQEEYPQLKAIRDIKITKKDRAGLVLEAIIRGAHASITLSGRKLYKLFKNVRSYCFNIHKRGDVITFKGRGFGHHLGLCQWGARALVRDGWDYRGIISFYYPHTKLLRLSL